MHKGLGSGGALVCKFLRVVYNREGCAWGVVGVETLNLNSTLYSFKASLRCKSPTLFPVV